MNKIKIHTDFSRVHDTSQFALDQGVCTGGVGDPKYIIFWLRFACPEFSPYIICFFPNSLFTCKVEIQPSQKKFIELMKINRIKKD